jgi:hypothetical protein
MRKQVLFVSGLLIFAVTTCTVGQQKSDWQRAYVFDESVIEMNMRSVVVTGLGFGLAVFRWRFDKSQNYSLDPKIKYRTRVERIEFNCTDHTFRTYDQALVNAQGKVVRYDANYWLGDWQKTSSSVVMSTIEVPACAAIKPVQTEQHEQAEYEQRQKVEKLAAAFMHRLEQGKSFRAAAAKYFAPNYIYGYRRGEPGNRFVNLSPEVIAHATDSDLRRYDAALMDFAYWSARWVSSLPATDDGDVSTERLAARQLLPLIKQTSYTKKYRRSENDFNYLEEKIDSVARLQSYTSLLEHVVKHFQSHAKPIRRYDIEEDDTLDFSLSEPTEVVCATDCLNYPKGTVFWDIHASLFRLRVAEVKGKLRIVSVRPAF